MLLFEWESPHHEFQAHVLELLVPSSQHCFGRVHNFVMHTVSSHLTYLWLSPPFHNEQWDGPPPFKLGSALKASFLKLLAARCLVVAARRANNTPKKLTWKCFCCTFKIPQGNNLLIFPWLFYDSVAWWCQWQTVEDITTSFFSVQIIFRRLCSF